MEFADQQAYDAYNPHPKHVAFVQNRWNREVEKFLEIDYASGFELVALKDHPHFGAKSARAASWRRTQSIAFRHHPIIHIVVAVYLEQQLPIRWVAGIAVTRAWAHSCSLSRFVFTGNPS